MSEEQQLQAMQPVLLGASCVGSRRMARLEAATRTCVSFRRLGLCGCLPRSLGTDANYAVLADTLFRHIAALASAPGLSILRKARFSALLYQLFYEAFPVYDARRAAQCRNATPVVSDGFLHAEVDEETLQAVLLCRLYDAYPSIEDDETDDGLVHACFSRWAISLSPFGFWPGVDDAQAWGRIGLMLRHASMYGCSDYCSVIRLARSCYESRLSCVDVSPSVLCRAYDAIALGDASPDNEALLRSLADRLCVLSTSYAPGSGESLLSLACCAEELCRRILGREEQTIGIGSYSEEAIP